MSSMCQSFNEDINDLEIRGNMRKSIDIVIIGLLDEIMVHVNMFCPLMKKRDWS